MNMKLKEVKQTMKVKVYRDFSRDGTPQERHMENVERGYTTNVLAMSEKAVKYEEIDGKVYKVVTL